YGKNAIFVFVLSALIARILIFTHVLQEGDKTVSFKNYLYTNYITPGIEDPYLASFLFSVLFLSGFLPLLWLFNKFKIFIKL
ncbi:MAG: hypothetical protein OEZ34_17085, partial [Spirochaetia bacterium]|nr:hypothetical protein [Spirochaetia bacterium]